MNRSRRFRSRGFSLVELLVVIAIIAILIGMLVTGLGMAVTRTKNARIKLEVAGLASALERYRQEYGEFPPDFTTGNPVEAINAHLVRKFRYRAANDVPPELDLTLLDPPEALVFWLRGFSPDARRPVGGMGERTPLFEFNQARLTDMDNDGHPEYVPQDGKNVPYLYYNAKNYEVAVTWAEGFSTSRYPVPRPYLSEVSTLAAAATDNDDFVHFAEPEKFQIISAGLDGEFGVGLGMYPIGTGYTPADRDNITNFIEGGTLEGDIP